MLVLSHGIDVWAPLAWHRRRALRRADFVTLRVMFSRCPAAARASDWFFSKPWCVLEKLIMDDQLRCQMGIRARERVGSAYLFEHFKARLSQVVADLCAS